VSESSNDEHENWEKADEGDATTTKKVSQQATVFETISAPGG